MKKVIFLAIVMAVSIFYSCETESVENNESKDVTEITATQLNSRDYNRVQIRTFGFDFLGRCFQTLNRQDVCSIELLCEGPLFDPGEFCELMPCEPEILDPQIYTNLVDPKDFSSLYKELGLKINPKKDAVSFPVSKGLLGIQYYHESGGFKNNVYRLKNNQILDTKFAKSFGLRGNMVPAGNYPVIYNKENGTHNVILAVNKGYK